MEIELKNRIKAMLILRNIHNNPRALEERNFFLSSPNVCAGRTAMQRHEREVTLTSIRSEALRHEISLY